MSLDIQFKIKNNPNYLKYLRQNSEWYKVLNRSPESFSLFEETAKEQLRLRPTDRISKVLETFEMVSTILSTLK